MNHYSAERESFRKSLDIDDFVSEARLIVQDYRCPLCLGIYYSPVVDECGHCYCHPCIKKYLETNEKCPMSGEPITEKQLKKVFIMTEILDKQSVLCKNRHYHCDWSGKLSELENHLNNDCARQIVVCPHLRCEYQVFREDLHNHCRQCDYRIVSCDDCQIQLAFLDVKTHQEECPRFKIPCPQECCSYVERQDMNNHISQTCINTVIDCPYTGICCENKITKRELNDYLTANTNRHNLLLIDFLRNFFTDMNTKMANFQNVTLLALNQFEEKQKKMELILSVHSKENQLKENINRENSISSINTKRVNLSINEMSPKKDKSATQSKNSQYSGVNQSQTQITFKDSPADQMMNRKRQRTEEPALVNINKETVVDLVEETQEEEKEMKISECEDNPPMTFTNDLIKKEIFDSVNISRGIQITQTRVTCLSIGKTEHRYVFANIPLNQEKEFEWRVTLNVTSQWAAVGVCSKEIVINNKYRFVTNNINFNNATSAISMNGYSWNCNVPSENNSSLPNFPAVKQGEIIIFKYFSELKELHYKFPGKISGKLNNVQSAKGSTLVPCIVLLNPGDEILLETM